MAINDHRKEDANHNRLRYNMWNSWDLNDDGKPASDIVAHVRRVADSAPGGRLENLIINCHGMPAFLQVGRGINTLDLPLFQTLHRKIGTIYIQACLVARVVTEKQFRQTYPHFEGDIATALPYNDGNTFASVLARTVGCVVVAPTSEQWFYGRDLPFGTVDEFEGLVLWYGPNGSVIQSVRYPYITTTADGHEYVLPTEDLPNPSVPLEINRSNP